MYNIIPKSAHTKTICGLQKNNNTYNEVKSNRNIAGLSGYEPNSHYVKKYDKNQMKYQVNKYFSKLYRRSLNTRIEIELNYATDHWTNMHRFSFAKLSRFPLLMKFYQHFMQYFLFFQEISMCIRAGHDWPKFVIQNFVNLCQFCQICQIVSSIIRMYFDLTGFVNICKILTKLARHPPQMSNTFKHLVRYTFCNLKFPKKFPCFINLFLDLSTFVKICEDIIKFIKICQILLKFVV